MQTAWMSYGFVCYEAMPGFTKFFFDEMKEILEEYKEKYGVQYVFSYNYIPDLAEACYEKGIYYISWTIDAPHVALWSKTTSYPTNRIFCFDAAQYQELADRGENNIWHLPLAADINYFTKTVQEDGEASKEKYASDAAFVGNLYTDTKHSLYDRIQYMPPYLSGYLEAIMYAQRQLWGIDLLKESISPKVWKLLENYVKCEWGEDYYAESYKQSIVTMLGQKLAQEERKEVCSYLARNFDFALYTGSDTSFDKAIQNRGYANYLTQMPLIFHYAKININVTSRTIPSGIPQRVLDVLACEGFLLTNYQPEIAQYFEDGKELVIYTDFRDMYQKISYYLVHDDERRVIAHRGYQKVKELFSYRRGVGKIVQVLKETTDIFFEQRCKALAENRNQLVKEGRFEQEVLELFQSAEREGELDKVKQIFMNYILNESLTQ